MARTPAELESTIAKRLSRKMVNDLTVADLISVIDQDVLNKIKDRNPNVINELADKLETIVTNAAKIEAGVIVAKPVITVADLDLIL